VRLDEFEALSFDCYGTLIDWEAGLAAVLWDWASRRNVQMDDRALLTAYASHEAIAESTHPGDLYPDILARSMRELGAELRAEVTATDAEALARSVPDWPAFPDAHDALAALSKRYKLIILSNVDRASFAASKQRLGVEFASVLTAEDIGSYKPSPRNFDALIAETRRLGIGDGKLLHVAQSLFHDHVPAKNAGLPTVWINRRHAKPGWGATPAPETAVTPDWTFPSMVDFAAAVDSAAWRG
jgi:2-haloacid dehalogenase